MDTFIPQQDSLMDMDDWYNFTLPAGDMAEPFGCLSNPLAPYCQPNTADFTQSPQYFDNNGTQHPWDSVDTSLFYQNAPAKLTTTASTPFPQYLLGPAQSYSPDNSDSSIDYQLPDLEPSVSDSSACSEVEDYTTAVLQRTSDSTPRRGRSREKRAINKTRKITSKTAAPLDQTPTHRISKPRRTTSGDSEELDRVLAKQTHSDIERKYRNNLNAKMWQLHHALEGTSRMSSSSDDSESPQPWEQQRQQQQQQQPPPPRKSDILSNALQYINESELEMRHMSDEILRLRNQLAMLQQMVQCDDDCAPLRQIVEMKMAS